jgi:succinate-semialdehyde dehydrogenase/glutarate-semialdehyde dehydrogenase
MSYPFFYNKISTIGFVLKFVNLFFNFNINKLKMSIITINPSTGKKLKTYREHSIKQINRIIENSHRVLQEWKYISFSSRAKLMKQAAKILLKNKNKYASQMAYEMGKPLTQGIAEIEKCAFVCNYYAEGAKQFLKEELIITDFIKSYIAFQPLGVILAIMPWNFPFWQVFRFAAPALMAGNVAILKHSSNTVGCAIEIEKVFADAGFPKYVFSSLIVSSKLVEKIIENPLINAVTLTGSTPAGSQVAAKSGRMIKKTVMELGGSDPYIILSDADLNKAAEVCASARLINSGQSCIAAKRFIVIKEIKNKFEELFIEEMKKAKMGNPFDDGVTVGPQARKDLQIDLQRQVYVSVKRGAKLLLGGQIPDSDGFFYPPTVLTNVRKGMPCYDEEVFGPAAAIIEAKDINDAIRIANDTEFGLGAAIFTEDKKLGEKIALEQLQAGSCFVNNYVRSDPRLPFGGIKMSGYGRELSVYGIKEFVNIKTVCIS